MAKTLDEAGVKRLIQEIKGANKNLNAPISISTENTPESMAQNVKNIADYVEKAKAAGIANVDGIGVTCLINGGISGLGYIYVTGNSFDLIGMMMWDDMVDNAFFKVSGGEFNSRKIAFEGTVDTVTSDMLVKGARKPIILTPSTTEVDEETYQKLLSDDVDVMFKTSTGDANLCTLTYKYDDGDVWSFTFTSFSHEGVSLSETFLYGYEVRITKTGNPHQCEVINNSGDFQFDSILLNEGFIRKSTLTPVLKKINLRKGNNSAVIKQFEADWENLNGSVFGARFIGFPAGTLPVLFMKDDFNDCYIGYTDRNLDGGSDSTGPFKKITLCANDNYNLKVTDVPATVQYIDLNSTTTNLTSIGAVQQNTPHCFTYTKDSEIIKGVGQVWQSSSYGYLEGISFDGKYRVHAEVQANGAATVTLTSIGAQKLLQPVLQEINLTGTDADRKAKLDQFEADWKALTGASDLTGARFVGKLSDYYDGVTIIFTYNSTPDNETYQYNWNGIYIPGYDEDANGDQIYAVYYVTINPLNGKISYVNQIANMATYDFRGNLRLTYGASLNSEDIYLGATYDDDTGEHIESLTFSNVRLGKVATPKTGDEVTNKAYVDAIKNNASKSLEAITIKTGNTPEDKAANVAAIKAYVDNLIALGVDTTKGYMIPVNIGNAYYGFIMGTGTDGEHTGVIKRSIYYYGGGWIFIDKIGTYYSLEFLTSGSYQNLTTTEKTIVPAINEVNANAVHSDKLVPTLEAITIYTDNTPEHMQANLDNIAAYKANLEALGVDTTKGYMIPITASGRNGFLSTRSGNYPYAGYAAADSSVKDFYNILILGNGEYYDSKIQSEVSGNLHTTSKQIVGAINEINANAVHSDKLVPTLEAITIKTNNTPDAKAANVAAIKAYVDNLKLLGVDTTKGYMIPAKLDLGIFGGFLSYHSDTADFPWSGVFIKSGGSGRFVRINKDGLVALMPDILNSGNTYTTLTTTSKGIIPAINEVNALAKSKQDALTSGTNIKTVNGQSLLGSGDIAISGGGGSASVLVDIDDITGSAGVSVPVDVFNKIANAASAKTPIFGYSKLVNGPRTTYEIIPLYIKNISTTAGTNGSLSIQFIAENAYNSVGIMKSSDTECSISISSSRPFALDTSVDKSSTRGIQSSAVWNEIHSEPMTVNTATSGVTTLSSTDKHKILCYADSGTQQYNLPSSPVDGETFLFLKVKSGHTITIQSGTSNQNIYDCSSGNSVVSKTIETSTKRKITVTYSSTVDKWFLMADDFIS